MPYDIPKKYIKKSVLDSSPNESAGLDESGAILFLEFEAKELAQEVEGYNLYQDVDNKFPSIFTVLVYEGTSVDRYASKYYEDLVSFEGDYSEASVLEDHSLGFYRVAPNVDGAARWVYFSADPRAIDSIEGKLDLIVAECSSILPKYKLAKCVLSVEENDLFLQINLSEINLRFSHTLKEYVLNKLSQWQK